MQPSSVKRFYVRKIVVKSQHKLYLRNKIMCNTFYIKFIHEFLRYSKLVQK